MQLIGICGGKQGVSEPRRFIGSRTFASVPVHEVFRGKTAWQGDVEVFDLSGRPKAKRCYGRTHGEPEEFITILELPPVDLKARQGRRRLPN